MMLEYKTILHSAHPDGVLNAAATEGWECYAVTPGGFDRDGRHHPIANTLWLRRQRVVPPPDPIERRPRKKEPQPA